MESIYKGSAGAIFIFMSTVYRKSKNMSQPGVAGHRLRSAEGVAKNVSHLSRRQLYWHRALGRVEGALLEGKTWKIPSTAEKPDRKPRHSSAEENLLASSSVLGIDEPSEVLTKTRYAMLQII